MKIQKAIDVLYDLSIELDRSNAEDEVIALNIGIEALKFRLVLERDDPEIALKPLLGETEA